MSHDEWMRYWRILKKAKRDRKYGKQFTLVEMHREIGKLKDSAPGIDRVVKAMLPKKASNLNKLLLYLNKSIFTNDAFDPRLNKTRLQLIPKPDSDKLRPLGIGLRVGAIMDRLAASRFDVLIHLDPVYRECYGFKTVVNTEDFFGRMFGIVEAKKLEGKYVSITQLDVKGAYTSVPHVKLILAMDAFINRTADPKANRYLIHFTAKWLENRTVRFERTEITMLCGLVQGSPVSPPIFVIFMCYESTSANTIILKFADDFSQISWAPTPAELLTEVKTEMKKFETWLDEREMKFEPTKSKFMLFGRTIGTAKKHFSDVGVEIVDGLRVLGLWITSMLCFHQHVNKVANKLRSRVNALRLFKKIGLSIDHAIQFSTCVANSATYGLWWHAYLSVSDWKRLETLWTKLLKISVHEKCPRPAIPSKIRDLLGIRDFRSFSDYLVHLRTAGHHTNPRCARFTLSPQELQEHRNFQPGTSQPTRSRPSTQQQSAVIAGRREREKAEKKLGTLKMHSITVANSHG